jgi:quercetin dioxygenase-like cupin family protein
MACIRRKWSLTLQHVFSKTVHPGDLIYFPDRYWHATINIDPYTAFVSTFTQEHDSPSSATALSLVEL